MRRLAYIPVFIVLLLLGCTTSLSATGTMNGYGLPFVTCYLPNQYNAHAISYDITTDGNGSVFVANFEGLLYFDGATWRKIHTPGISRITRVERDNNGRIWVGGYNIFGYLEPYKNGQLQLHTIVSDRNKFQLGEVNGLKCLRNNVYVRTSAGHTYIVKDDKALKRIKGTVNFDTEQTVDFHNWGLTITVKHTEGLAFHNGETNSLMTEKDGLCSNTINALHYDGKHTVWGATNNGLFAIEIPSPFTHLDEGQGLKGEVYAVNKLGNTYYVGTLQGLYRVGLTKAEQVEGIKSACWDIINFGTDELLAATSEGVLRIKANGSIEKLNSANTTALCVKYGGKDIYAGELDGIYHYNSNGKQRQRISNMGNLLSLSFNGKSFIAETVSGQQWNIPVNTNERPKLLRQRLDPTKPELDTNDMFGRRWTTETNSKGLTLITSLARYDAMKMWIKPLGHLAINDIYSDDENSVMVGGPFGIIYCNLNNQSKRLTQYTKNVIPVYIRRVAMDDDILWGGYSVNTMQPSNSINGLRIPSDCNSLTITFSLKDQMSVTPSSYRYRINSDRWSAWDNNTEIRISNISYGKSTVEIEARDMFGRVTPAAKVAWFKEFPLYLRWYAVMIYFALLVAVVTAVGRWRTRKLTKAKEELEQVVRERTSELSNALNHLKKAQSELVRMERAATAGKLTQGLIDRILNPINYINNFAKLSSGLAADLAQDIEDEKDNMGQDNYEDCLDILQMMKQNLGKIEQHGVNTTRMLRAMEAMLKTSVKELHDTDLNAICQRAVNISSQYQKDKLEADGINITALLPTETVVKPLDSDAFCSMLIALITNAVYAVRKRKQKTTAPDYKPEVTLTLATDDNDKAIITVHDNGTGIEEAIREKIFDPFFTTKTTGEAAGVGLYLAREVVQAHNGTIALGPEKPGQTDFIITL